MRRVDAAASAAAAARSALKALTTCERREGAAVVTVGASGWRVSLALAGRAVGADDHTDGGMIRGRATRRRGRAVGDISTIEPQITQHIARPAPSRAPALTTYCCQTMPWRSEAARGASRAAPRASIRAQNDILCREAAPRRTYMHHPAAPPFLESQPGALHSCHYEGTAPRAERATQAPRDTTRQSFHIVCQPLARAPHAHAPALPRSASPPNAVVLVHQARSRRAPVVPSAPDAHASGATRTYYETTETHRRARGLGAGGHGGLDGGASSDHCAREIGAERGQMGAGAVAERGF